MGVRRKARECALQILYQSEAETLSPSPTQEGGETNASLHQIEGEALQNLIHSFFQHFAAPQGVKGFSRQLVLGAHLHLEEIDSLLRKHSKKWKLERMDRVDRNILRLCTFELLYRPQLPHRVIIDEGIEIAKRFGSEQSGAFVNGILDQVLAEVRPNLPPSPTRDEEQEV